MTPNRDEMYALRERIAKLTREEQLLLAEDILRSIRKEHFTDHEALDRDAAEMAADPGMQKVLRGEDLPYPERLNEAG